MTGKTNIKEIVDDETFQSILIIMHHNPPDKWTPFIRARDPEVLDEDR